MERAILKSFCRGRGGHLKCSDFNARKSIQFALCPLTQSNTGRHWRILQNFHFKADLILALFWIFKPDTIFTKSPVYGYHLDYLIKLGFLSHALWKHPKSYLLRWSSQNPHFNNHPRWLWFTLNFGNLWSRHSTWRNKMRKAKDKKHTCGDLESKTILNPTWQTAEPWSECNCVSWRPPAYL